MGASFFPGLEVPVHWLSRVCRKKRIALKKMMSPESGASSRYGVFFGMSSARFSFGAIVAIVSGDSFVVEFRAVSLAKMHGLAAEGAC